MVISTQRRKLWRGYWVWPDRGIKPDAGIGASSSHDQQALHPTSGSLHIRIGSDWPSAREWTIMGRRMSRKTVVFVLVSLSLAALSAVIAQSGQYPVNWTELPKPFHTESVSNGPEVIA